MKLKYCKHACEKMRIAKNNKQGEHNENLIRLNITLRLHQVQWYGVTINMYAEKLRLCLGKI